MCFSMKSLYRAAVCVAPLLASALAAHHQTRDATGYVYVIVDDETTGCLTDVGGWDVSEDAECREVSQQYQDEDGGFTLNYDEGAANIFSGVFMFGSDIPPNTFHVDENANIISPHTDSADWYTLCIPDECEAGSDDGNYYIIEEDVDPNGNELPMMVRLKFISESE